jgi:hypothetical protein
MMNLPPMSCHAKRRCRQRGVRSSILNTLIECHDADVAVGDDCRALRLSRNMLCNFKSDGIDRQQIDKLKGLVVIWSDRKKQVVTVFRDEGQTRGRRYRTNN